MKTIRMQQTLSRRSLSVAVVTMVGTALLPFSGHAQGFGGTNDSHVVVGAVPITAPSGPDYPSISNGNFTYALPFGTLATQSGPLGLADEGMGKGITAFARANVQANGEVWIREANGTVSKYAATGASKDFLLGDLSTISRTGAAVTRTHSDGSKEVYAQSTAKGLYLTSVFDAFGNETKFSYDAGSLFPKEVASPGRERVTTIERTIDGKIGKVKGHTGDFIAFSYANGYLEKVSDRFGKPLIEIGRDSVGQGLPTTFRSDGKYDLIVSYSVDTLGGTPRLLSIEYANNDRDTYTYKIGGTEVKRALPNGTEYLHEYLYQFHQASQKVLVGQTFLNKSKNPRPISDVRFNTAGQVTSATNARGQTTRYTYNPGAPLPSSISYPDGTSEAFTYTPTFKILTHLKNSPAGLTTTSYDWLGYQLRKQVTKNSTNEVTDESTYTYDGAKLYPTSVTATQRTAFTLDPVSGIPTKATLPGGTVVAKSWSPNSQTLTVNGLSFKDTWAFQNGALTQISEGPLSKTSVTSLNDGTTTQEEFWRNGLSAGFPSTAGRTHKRSSQYGAAMANAVPLDGSDGWFGVKNAMAIPAAGNPHATTNQVECSSSVDRSRRTCTCVTDPNSPCGCTWNCETITTAQVPNSTK